MVYGMLFLERLKYLKKFKEFLPGPKIRMKGLRSNVEEIKDRRGFPMGGTQYKLEPLPHFITPLLECLFTW